MKTTTTNYKDLQAEKRQAEREAKTYNDHLTHTAHQRAIWSHTDLAKELAKAKQYRKVVKLVNGHYKAVTEGK